VFSPRRKVSTWNSPALAAELSRLELAQPMAIRASTNRNREFVAAAFFRGNIRLAPADATIEC